MKTLFLLVVAMILAGCAAPNYRDVATQYASVEELVAQEFPKKRYFGITAGDIYMFHVNRVERARNTLEAYCTTEERGEFHQMERQDIISGNEHANRNFGVFGCYRDEVWRWAVEVKRQFDHVGESFIVVNTFPINEYLIAQHEIAANRATEARRDQLARDRFATRAREDKPVGLQVCSSDNLFGYVQQAGSGNLMVQVVGGAHLPPYGFFQEANRDFVSQKLDETRWYPSEMWARCSFR